MARVRQTRDETRRVVVSRLDWRSAQRDDQAVAQAIHAGESMDGIYNLDEAGLLDGFYHFLDAIGFLGLIGGLGLPGVKRVVLPVLQFVLLYLLKTLYGIASMNALPPLLFSNVALMRLIGFNAHQIGQGLTRRGDARRRLRPKRGPLSPQCLAQNMESTKKPGVSSCCMCRWDRRLHRPEAWIPGPERAVPLVVEHLCPHL